MKPLMDTVLDIEATINGEMLKSAEDELRRKLYERYITTKTKSPKLTRASNVSYGYGDYLYSSPNSTKYELSKEVWGDPLTTFEDQVRKAIQEGIDAAMKEFTETLKDLQEQIDDIWEALKDDE